MEKWERLDQIISQMAQESGLDRESLIDLLDPRNSFPFESEKIAS